MARTSAPPQRAPRQRCARACLHLRCAGETPSLCDLIACGFVRCTVVERMRRIRVNETTPCGSIICQASEALESAVAKATHALAPSSLLLRDDQGHVLGPSNARGEQDSFCAWR